MNYLKITLLCLFLLPATLIEAQVSIGVKTGYTLAWEYYNTDLPDDAQITVNGMNASAQVYWKMGKHLNVGIEPGFVQRGAACVPGWMPIFIGDTKFFLNYLEAPIMISGDIPLWKGKGKLYGKLGYGMSLLVSAIQETTSEDDANPIVREKMELGDNSILNRWDNGFYSGLGLGLKVGPGHLFYETNFYLGLHHVERANFSQNRSLNFNLGYMIDI